MDINLIENLIKELQSKGKVETKEELETLITDLHRVKNDMTDLQDKNEELNNRFGLFWKEVPEKMIKNISDNEIVYGKSLYTFITKIKNGEGKTIKADINGEETKLSRQADSYLFKDSENNEYLVFSDSLYRFSKETQEEYIPILKEKGSDFFVGDNENNILIEGDNYYALQMLQYTHKEKVDVIYIDPPYNTGNKDFKYNDRFLKSGDLDKHSSWLSFMKKRLELSKKILSKNGVIFIHIDQNELHNLKLLCDKIFPYFQSMITIQVKSPSGDSSKSKNMLEDVNEYILCYSMCEHVNHTKPKQIKEIVDYNSKTSAQYNMLVDSYGQRTNEYFEFEVGHGKNKTTVRAYKMKGFSSNTVSKNDRTQDFYVKNIDNICQTAKFSGAFEKAFKNKKNEVYEFDYITSRGDKKGIVQKIRVVNGRQLIYLKDYVEEVSLEGRKAIAKIEKSTNIITDITWHGIAGEGGVEFKNGKKPIKLIKKLLSWINKKDLLILDFFAGSGTTGHAVWDLNKEDSGKRKFILCTNNENNICEDVTFERLKKSNKKHEYNESLKYLTINHVSEKIIRKEDNRGKFETLKEIVNLKYNSFKVIEENDEWYVNENIAILKDFDYIEEFKEKFEDQEYLGFVTNEETEWDIFKEKLTSIKKEDNLTQFSSSYMNEIRKVIKGRT